MKITKKTVLKRIDHHLLASKVFEDVVMLDTETGDYFGLGTVGGALWESLKEANSLMEIFPKIEEKFEVTEEQFYEDVLPFIEQLLQNRLLEIEN